MADAPLQNSFALPKPKRKVPVALIGLLAAIVLGVFGANQYIARHRTLHLISGLKEPVTVTIDGGAPTTLSGPFPTTVPIAEGPHHVVISGGLTDELDITLSSGFFDRFFSTPLFVLNPGGTSLLTHETVVYTKVQLPNGGGSFEFLFGQPYLQFPDVDYAFLPFPKTINANHDGNVSRSRIGLVEEPVSKVIVRMLSDKKDADAVRLAEWQLKLHPEDTRTLELYLAITAGTPAAVQAHAFVKERLKVRPLEPEWHRIFLQMTATDQEREELAEVYDALLKAEPENAPAFYLRGLLFKDGAHARPYFEQAIQKASKLIWPRVALAQYFVARGDWKAAKAQLELAHTLAPDNEDINDQFDDARFALGEYGALEADLGRELTINPGDIKLNIHLCDVFVAQHKPADAKALAENFAALLGAQNADGLNLGQSFFEYTLYAINNFAELEKTAPKGSKIYFQTLFELGRIKELCEQMPLNGQTEPFWALAISAAWKSKGDDAKAKLWRQKAASLFKTSTGSGGNIAAILLGTDAPTLEAVADLGLSPKQEATLLAVLAQEFPAKAEEFRTLARALNTDFAFPYYFLKTLLK